MIIDILQHTPMGVWLLFAALIALGLMQTRERTISRVRAFTLPLVFIVLSFSGVLRGGGSFLIAIIAWGIGAGGAWLLARRAVAVCGASWIPSTSSFHVPGSWLPLTLIVGAFVLRYVVAVAQAMHPELGADPRFYGTANVLCGVFAGLFWARSFSLRKLARAADADADRDANAGRGAALRHTA